MLALERQNEILAVLKREKSVSVPALSRRFFTCESTIRRDLQKLEQCCLVKRTYGGAVLLEGLNTEIPFSVREHEQAEEKSRIGRLAAGLVRDGDSLILDSSSTAFQILKYLNGRENLVILTNGIRTAMAAGQELHCQVYCTGGALRENSSSIVGDAAVRFIQEHSAQKLFFSSRTLSGECEAMDASEEEAVLRRAMIARAESVYLLCDHTKMGKNALHRICGPERFTALITDRKPPASILEQLLKQEIEVLY